MQAFAILPVADLYGNDAPEACRTIDIITDIVVLALSAGESAWWAITWVQELARPEAVFISTVSDLRKWVRLGVNPAGTGPTIRAQHSCRAVTFGYDGQAFLILRHGDPPLPSLPAEIATVEPRPDLLIDSDYWDGHIAGELP